MAKTKTTTEEIKKVEGEANTEVKDKAPSKTPKKKIVSGVLHIDATFNNTKVLFSDKLGNTLFWSSAGSLGFRGAKKGTPFAASKVGDVIGSKAAILGVKDSDVVVLGVGSWLTGLRLLLSKMRHQSHTMAQKLKSHEEFKNII
jgi:ribosomal protein S11